MSGWNNSRRICIPKNRIPYKESGSGITSAAPIEFRTGVVCPIRAAAQDFKGLPIVKIPGNGTATNGNTAQIVPVITGHGELAANGRDAVPVILAHILPRRPQVAGLDFQRHFYACPSENCPSPGRVVIKR